MKASLKKYTLVVFSAGVTLFSAALNAQNAAPVSWVPTATQGISLSSLLSAVDGGVAAAEQPLTVRVALKPRNQAALVAYVKAINDPTNALYGQSLTPGQFKSYYGPTTASVQAVTGYLVDAGFTNVVVEPNNLLISADGNIGAASAAFNTQIHALTQFGKPVIGNTTAAMVPASLSNIVSAVLGLNTIGQMKSQLRTKAQFKPAALPSLPVSLPQYDVSYTPKQFQAIYGVGSVAPDYNHNIAIMAEGDLTGVLADLKTAEAAFGLPQVAVTVVPVGLPSTDVSGADEWDMDTQYSTGMAGFALRLYLYDVTSLDDSDLALEFSRWATDDVAKAASASLGECEIFPYLDGSMVVDDMTFLEAAAQGQTFFASSGDTGSFCPVSAVGVNGVPAGAPLVQYPAASPYVVAVGGTTLLTNADGSYDTEITWYAGGGGISQFEGPGYWQTGAGILSGTALNSRGVPDIALDADPYSGATVYVDGAPEGVGGTSLSSPLALGVWARIVSGHYTMGFASPHLYGLYNGSGLLGEYPSGGYHDITVGANGLYVAAPGWDYTTGLGSPIVSQLYSAIQ
jgi:subtilase family serine protease